MLHLHRFQDEQQVAFRDRVARGDGHADDLPGHRGGDAALRTGARAAGAERRRPLEPESEAFTVVGNLDAILGDRGASIAAGVGAADGDPLGAPFEIDRALEIARKLPASRRAVPRGNDRNVAPFAVQVYRYADAPDAPRTRIPKHRADAEQECFIRLACGIR